MFEADRFTPEEISTLRDELVKYCKADTESLAKLLNTLKDPARAKRREIP
jgi:hypothetical protein